MVPPEFVRGESLSLGQGVADVLHQTDAMFKWEEQFGYLHENGTMRRSGTRSKLTAQ